MEPEGDQVLAAEKGLLGCSWLPVTFQEGRMT